MGSLLNTSGAIIKCFSSDPSLSWLAFLGQTLSAMAMPFLLEVPPRLAAIWFPSTEVSTATAIGVFGNQLGVAIGFVIPPLLVPGPVDVFFSNGSYPSDWSDIDRYPDQAPEAIEVVSEQIGILSITFAVMCSVSLLSIIFFFKNEPLHPPSVAESNRRIEEANETDSPAKVYFASLKALMSNRSYVLLVISYGLNGGCYYALSTLLNQIIKPSLLNLNFTSAELDAKIGSMGNRVHKLKTTFVFNYSCIFLLNISDQLVFYFVYDVTNVLIYFWISNVNIELSSKRSNAELRPKLRTVVKKGEQRHLAKAEFFDKKFVKFRFCQISKIFILVEFFRQIFYL